MICSSLKGGAQSLACRGDWGMWVCIGCALSAVNRNAPTQVIHIGREGKERIDTNDNEDSYRHIPTAIIE